jgi:uroporphyrin-III C-methyltransferase/precorrin-2 dehydrogenase/sirohydrochlorin ferrochelatase
MEFLPIFLRLEGRLAVLVGGGEIAARKIELLRRAGARIRVVAPVLAPQLATLDGIEHRARRFHPDDLDGAELVIAATDDRAVNAAVAAAARARHLPVNVVDDPALCSFIMPAIVDRGRVVAAISTGGASPVLARLLRGRLELALPPGIERLADLAAAWRGRVKAALPDSATRRRFWEALMARPVPAGDMPDFDEALAALKPAEGRMVTLDVPVQDPDALTLRALRLLQSADCVVHDPAIPAAILDFARRDARLVAMADPTAAQEAGAGELVVVLRATPVPPRWFEPRRSIRARRQAPFRYDTGIARPPV